jgi:hypothetical protein
VAERIVREGSMGAHNRVRGHILAFDLAPNGTLAKQTDRVFVDVKAPSPAARRG